jgi:hypothetical protein
MDRSIMARHTIKCKPEFFQPLLEGLKNNEVRENDRDYQVGDILTIKEFDPRTQAGYTGRQTMRLVMHVLRDFPAVDSKYVVLSLK